MTPLPSPLVLAGCLVLGLALGAAYFALLRRTVRLHGEGAAPGWIALHYAVRIGAALAVFVTVARLGAWPLLTTFAGFVVARVAVLRVAKGGG